MNAEERLLRAIFAAAETDEQRAARELEEEARLRAWRARKALQQAPALAGYVRAHVLATVGERGFEMPEAVTPLSTLRADDADALYARLVDWVTFWSRWLDFMPTGAVAIAWSRVDQGSRAAAPDVETLGFRAGTTSGAASLLVSAQVQWLLRHEGQIVRHPLAAGYQDDVNKMVWDYRARYALTPARVRSVRAAVCPVCGERAIGAYWRSEQLLDVEISCDYCGHVVDAPRASDISRWVPMPDPSNGLSEACEVGRHFDPAKPRKRRNCLSVNCACGCHLPVSGPFGDDIEKMPARARRLTPFPASSAVADARVCPRCWLFHAEGACQE